MLRRYSSRFLCSPHLPISGGLISLTPARRGAEGFLRGALLLHSFEFDDAARISEAQKIEPGFAMAYWGEAMTYNHPLWMEKDGEAARKVLERLAPAAQARLAKAPTEREKMYLEAVETLYGKGTRQATTGPTPRRCGGSTRSSPTTRTRRPSMLSLLGACEGKRDVATYMKAAAIAEEVFAKNPLHPGAVHYLIHSYDDPIHAPLGMRAARVYAKIAPAAGHALHMPAHIFAALGDWDQVIRANEIAVDVSEKRLHHIGRPISGRSHHALFWLEYALLQEGRADEAKTKLATAREDAVAAPREETLWHYAQMRTAWLVNNPGGTLDLAPIKTPKHLCLWSRPLASGRLSRRCDAAISTKHASSNRR